MLRRIFLSYTMGDKPSADRLKADVQRRFPSTQLFDFPTLPEPDADWRKRGDRMLRSSDAVICLVGARTATSAPVDWELRRAAALGKPQLAVVLSPHATLPAALTELGVPVYRWGDRMIAFEALESK